MHFHIFIPLFKQLCALSYFNPTISAVMWTFIFLWATSSDFWDIIAHDNNWCIFYHKKNTYIVYVLCWPVTPVFMIVPGMTNIETCLSLVAGACWQSGQLFQAESWDRGVAEETRGSREKAGSVSPSASECSQQNDDPESPVGEAGSRKQGTQGINTGCTTQPDHR